MQYLTRILVAAVLAALSGTSLAAEPSASPRWLPASPEKLPRWRGFNLLEKFNLGSGRKPFLEEDFRLISKLGFNFVRLPMDYRLWIKDGNWEAFDEAGLVEIDQAVAWGQKYGIHVCINFHRAPGYTVASPAEKTDLWTDAETQRVCAEHWAMFARRYRGIPSTRLSFNLMNEPGNVPPKVYAAVVRKLVEAIRREDPQRLIIADGLQWGNVPVPELRDLHMAQATRGYTPMEISHYKASWVNGENFPFPQWPRVLPPNGVLLGPDKPEGSRPLVIDGPFARPRRCGYMSSPYPTPRGWSSRPAANRFSTSSSSAAPARVNGNGPSSSRSGVFIRISSTAITLVRFPPARGRSAFAWPKAIGWKSARSA